MRDDEEVSLAVNPKRVIPLGPSVYTGPTSLGFPGLSRPPAGRLPSAQPTAPLTRYGDVWMAAHFSDYPGTTFCTCSSSRSRHGPGRAGSQVLTGY
jgi:hypothetical protein